MKKSLAFVVATLALSACGKSLHVSEKPAPQNLVKKNMLGEPIAEKVGEFSQADVEDLNKSELLLPFKGNDANRVFRSLQFLPNKEMESKVQSVSAQLILKGLKVQGKSVDDESLRELKDTATLCLVEKPKAQCAGKTMPDAIEQSDYIQVDKELEFTKNSSGEYSLDLIQAFGLENKNAAERIQFLRDNSKDYDKKGYHKLRMVIGKEIDFESGDLVIQTELQDGEKIEIEVPGEPLDPKDKVDGELPGGKVAGKDANSATVSPGGGSSNDDKDQGKNELQNDATGTKEELMEFKLVKEIDSTKMKFTKGSGRQILKDENLTKLSSLTDVLKTYKGLLTQVEVKAQTDKSGTDSVNQSISTERAEYVKAAIQNALMSNFEVSSEVDLSAVGVGEVQNSSCGTNQTCPNDRKIILTIKGKGTDAKTSELDDALKAL
jgi:outer membrane protein OmpA-like peptidoglycan-associated protein